METVYLGDTVEGSPVYQDKYAHEADGVILCGRIKAHTSFRGPYESGLLKMSVIGMGKQHGAGIRPRVRLPEHGPRHAPVCAGGL